jgi:2-keto-3-deoxy-galactonokinase
VRLVADGTLAGLYTTAFRHLGRAVEVVDAEAATIRGLTRILEQAGLLA